jgi:REP element-mobilizing transposase RayT
LVSLEPTETISTCASKMKGRVSKWLSEELKLIEPEHLVSRGYFARTVGKSKPELIEEYLERQASHHGYDKRKLPPVFVKEYQLTANDKARLAAKHADALAQFHIVLASSYRVGVFGSGEGRTIASEWRRQQESLGIAIRKISFVPDHVHAAIRAHPATSLAVVVATLMNIAQASVPQALIRAGIDRLWTPSAYLGSYGNFATGEIGSYIQRLSFS